MPLNYSTTLGSHLGAIMKRSASIATTGLALALLAGCDGATITIEIDPQSSSSSSAPQSSSSSSIQSSSSEAQSSSSSSVHICDSDMPPPGAPACYRIVPECDDTMVCAIEFRTSDYCGVRGLDAEIIDVPGLNECDTIEEWDYQTCRLLNGATFLTTTLEEGGATQNGISKMHWRFTFDHGQVRLMQSDFGIAGSYTCRDDQVIVTLNDGSDVEHVLDIDARLYEFTFDPLGTGEKTYQNTYDRQLDTDDCRQVAGNHYVLRNDAASPLEKDYYLTFNEAPNTVSYSDGSKEENGYYSCDRGSLEVHVPSREYPLSVDVAEDGSSVTIRGETLLLNNPTPGFCTKEYAPVCGTQEVQCITAPCPPLHKTYGNQCEAESSNAAILFEGECGKLEGTPVDSLPVACPAVFDPVCAKKENKSVACITEPCPTFEYKTYGNSCSAAAQLAAFSFAGSCDMYGLEEHLSFQDTPVRLNMEADRTLLDVNFVKASIEDDVLTATVAYSGCDVQPINFTVDTIFLESFPVQANNYFSKTVNDACLAYFEQEYTFDLLPLQAAYKTLYQAESGEIILRDIGVTYRF